MFVTNKRFDQLTKRVEGCVYTIEENITDIENRFKAESAKRDQELKTKLEEFEIKVKQYENDRHSLQYFEGDFIEMKNHYKKLYNAYNDLKNKVEKGKK